MKKLIRNFLNKKGYYIFKEGVMPKGINFECDLKKVIQLDRLDLVMDVGAYHGYMTDQFLKTFRNAHIIAVEPSINSFTQLNSKFENNSRVTLLNCGAGGSESINELRVFDDGQLNSFKFIINDEYEVKNTVETHVHTIEHILDSIVPKRNSIDFLKIDVEGYEIDCLKGAENLLKNNEIGCVLIEAGFCNEDERHTPFRAINDMLIKNDFSFYGLYDLYHYRKPTELLFANALFLNENYLFKRKLLTQQ